MAEVLVVGPAVIAIIQITDRIVGLCKHYIETVRDAPSDLKVILVEISTLKSLLENLKFLSSCNSGAAGPLQDPSRLDQPITECLRLLEELEALFPPERLETSSQPSKRRKLKATFTELAWPLKESKARKLLERIRPLKETINLEITSQSRQDIREIKSQVSKTNEILTESQRQGVLKWLQHTDPSPLYHKAEQDHEPGTGIWVFQTNKWSDWIDLKTRCLWIHGIPGAGKTVLMYPLIQEIQKRCQTPGGGRCICLYYFCFYGHNQDEAKPFLRWLIGQLSRSTNTIPREVLSLHKKGSEPSLMELLEALSDLLAHINVVYVIIDALDESRPREELLQVVRHLATDEQFRKVQLLASSREYIDIERVLGETSTPLSMDNEFVGADIKTYVHSFIHSNDKFKRFPLDILDEIEDGVSRGARGMFRWAVCQLDILRRLKCDRDIIQRALKNLPKTLHETYDKIMLDFSEDQRSIVYCLFQWIQFYSELDYASIPYRILAQVAQKSFTEQDELQSGYYYDEDSLEELCGCLIKVSSEQPDEARRLLEEGDKRVEGYKMLTVKFAHYTVREYLDASTAMKNLGANLASNEDSRMRQPLKVVFEEAHQIHFNTESILKIKSANPVDVLDAIYDDFNIFCTVCALLALEHPHSGIPQQESIYSLAFSLLDPSGACFEALGIVVDRIDYTLEFLTSRNIYQGQLPWVVSWEEASNPIAVQLLHLFYITRCKASALPLIMKLLESNSMKLLTEDRLRFRKGIYDENRFYDWQVYVLDWSCLEAMAQCLHLRMDGFKLLLEISKGMFEPWEILRMLIARHFHAQCEEIDCVIEQLLRYGVNPNFRSHRVTSLQIGTACRDVDGVKMLLEAGVNPDDAGSDTEQPWEEGSFMSRYNPLHGASPFYLCRHLRNMGSPYLDNEKREREIDAILVEYGATSFSRVENIILTEDIMED